MSKPSDAGLAGLSQVLPTRDEIAKLVYRWMPHRLSSEAEALTNGIDALLRESRESRPPVATSDEEDADVERTARKLAQRCVCGHRLLEHDFGADAKVWPCGDELCKCDAFAPAAPAESVASEVRTPEPRCAAAAAVCIDVQKACVPSSDFPGWCDSHGARLAVPPVAREENPPDVCKGDYHQPLCVRVNGASVSPENCIHAPAATPLDAILADLQKAQAHFDTGTTGGWNDGHLLVLSCLRRLAEVVVPLQAWVETSTGLHGGPQR